MSTLDGSTLMISARSPFARRVRMAFIENEVKFEEKVLNVFEPNPELSRINPLARVPTLLLDGGQAVVDSSSILQVLYRIKRDSPLNPQTLPESMTCAHWSGIALGVCEKTVEYYLETTRPQALKDESVFVEAKTLIAAALNQFAGFVGNRQFAVGGRLTQTDLDWVAALGYVKLRLPEIWEKAPANLGQYLEKMEKRPSVQKTIPPR